VHYVNDGLHDDPISEQAVERVEHYRLLTIKPAPFLARPDINRWRPAHIHFSIRGGAARLITQMYSGANRYLNQDPGVLLLGEAQPRHIGCDVPSHIDGVQRLQFDIVIGGRNATMFEPDSRR